MAFETKLALIAALLVLSTLLGFYWRASVGRAKRIKSGKQVDLARLGATKNNQPVTKFGKKATLLQFSSEVCSQCAQTARYFGQLESVKKDLLHIDVDVTHRMDLAAHFNVLQTPTTLILDANGIVKARIGGTPRPNVISQELEKLDIK
jgi:thiol-disulfide isomerase/thioredoxin